MLLLQRLVLTHQLIDLLLQRRHNLFCVCFCLSLSQLFYLLLKHRDLRLQNLTLNLSLMQLFFHFLSLMSFSLPQLLVLLVKLKWGLLRWRRNAIGLLPRHSVLICITIGRESVWTKSVLTILLRLQYQFLMDLFPSMSVYNLLDLRPQLYWSLHPITVLSLALLYRREKVTHFLTTRLVDWCISYFLVDLVARVA